jgi:hypothetical protein
MNRILIRYEKFVAFLRKLFSLHSHYYNFFDSDSPVSVCLWRRTVAKRPIATVFPPFYKSNKETEVDSLTSISCKTISRLTCLPIANNLFISLHFGSL